MAASEVSDVKEQIDTLQSAVALLEKSMTQHGAVSPKRSKKGNRRYVSEESSDEESSSSEEEEPTPPPKARKVRKRKKKATGGAPGRKLTFAIDGPYQPNMKWDISWSKGMKAAFLAAEKEFHSTGTQEALKDKISGIKEMIKKGKKRGRFCGQDE